MSNLRHWSALSKTDPKHTKPFNRAGGFRGTATRPIWTAMRLTEHFGPCGIGWGCDAPEFALVPAGEETLVFCTLRCWYMDGETRALLYGVGGDKVYFKDKNGFHADDEAYKKAFTDALGNAFKHVGSGADIHMGLFEDSKYKADVAREFATEPADARSAAPPPQPSANGTGHQPATNGHLPPNPEEPPEVSESRQEMRRLLKAFREAASEKAVTAIWQANALEVAKIKRVGGDIALDALNKAAQERLDELRQGASI